MTRTFLVACDIDPTADVNEFALDILDSLQSDGIPATSCKPWASAMTEQSSNELPMPMLPSSFMVSP